MRLFVAVTPSSEAVEHLDAALHPVRKLTGDLRWSRPESWHITLAFLGEVTEPVAHDVDVRLARVARRHSRCELAFAGAGRFNGRVFWVGVRGDTAPLRRLADASAAAARRVDIPIEDRRFRPHLTLARARTPTDLRPLVSAFEAYQGPSWGADQLSLVRSYLQQGVDRGSRYEVLAHHPLTGKVNAREAWRRPTG
jgi:RNA 2',3'-cyclic 3'-phosphodiesterase